MKLLKYILPLIVLLSTSPSYAYPPYIAVDAAENLSFSNSTCISKAQKALEDDGFKKIDTQGTTVFAAYRDSSAYEYKAAIKCVSDSGVIIVTVVADSLRNIKAKAQGLRAAIQRNFSSQSFRNNSVNDDSDETSARDDKASSLSTDGLAIFKIASSWQSTKLSTEQCMTRAEIAIRNSGFSENLSLTKNIATGTNGQFTGSVKCLSQEGVILFTVTGTQIDLAERLLKTLEGNF